MKHVILASTSTVHNSEPLEYLQGILEDLFSTAETILFIPYARPSGISYDMYTKKISKAFQNINKKIKGIHEFDDPALAIKESQGIFIGGGNTFVLVNQLYKNQLITPLKEAIQKGIPYLGTSAGSNICGLSMHTTNDMPIVYPPSFKTLGIVPFNINPHYLDPSPDSKHMGETRETRIKEFHAYNSQPVIGLREGSYIEIKNDNTKLKGGLTARIFEKNKEPYEIENNTILNY